MGMARLLPPPAVISQRRVVVTGLGAVTPLANGMQASWERLLQGKCGIRRLKPSSSAEAGHVKVIGKYTDRTIELFFSRSSTGREGLWYRPGWQARMCCVFAHWWRLLDEAAAGWLSGASFLSELRKATHINTQDGNYTDEEYLQHLLLQSHAIGDRSTLTNNLRPLVTLCNMEQLPSSSCRLYLRL